MPNIIDILARAQSLMNETALNSITPPRAGGIMYDTLLVLNQMQLEGASLLISKVYASVSAMEADTTPTSDLTGRALKPGQLVVIVTSDTSSSDMGSEYRYNGPGSWTYVGKVGGLPLDTIPTQGSTKGITSGAVFQTKKDLEEQTDQLEAEVDELAEQGKEILGMLTDDTPIVLDDYPRISYAIDTNRKWNDGGGFACVIIPIASVKFVRCTADGGICQFAFLKTNDITVGATPDFADGTDKIFLQDGDTETYIVPGDAKYLYVYTHTTTTDISERYTDFYFYSDVLDGLENAIEGMSQKTIAPHFSYYTIAASTGQKAGNYFGTGAWTSTRFIGVCARTVSLKLGATRRVLVYEYDKDFAFLGRTVIEEVTADTDTQLNIAYADTRYIKLVILINSEGTGNAKTTALLTGLFPSDWDTFNTRPSDSGYTKVMIPVNVTNPTCCDEETQSVQDPLTYYVDYGVICLPKQYESKGKPTRLIIYCHGAGVNYSSSVSRFDSQDLDPTYWLAEGYAVMDVEGNPFNNSDEHFWIPQATDSYVAAYKWAIEYFNLRRDGVFLGGRSMGGGMVFALMRPQCPIPVLAACPNVPAACAMGTSSAARKAFWATHCGFDIPAGYSFGNGIYTNNDKALFLANYDKLIKNNPVVGMATDLPVTAEGKQAFVDCFAAFSDERVTLWKTYHLSVPCPVKLFGCNQDESCPIAYTSEVFYRMLINAGQVAELRIFNSYKDYTGTGTSAHHYDTQDPALRTDITTTYGEALTSVPMVYIEMLEFWRRYEQGN